MQTKPKAKRRLTDISFEHEGAHLALCSKSQGAANNYNTALIMKASKFSDEVIEKMQQIRVTMELPDFLQKFFYMYHEDAELLARMMGYVEPEEEGEGEVSASDYENYIEGKLQQFEVLKSLHEANAVTDLLPNLDENEYLGVLRDQEILEKAMKKADSKKANKPKAKVVKVDVKPFVAPAAVETSAIKKSEESMTQENGSALADLEIEVVEKSQFDVLEKAMADQAVELQKANEMLAILKAERQAAIEKARHKAIKDAVKDDDKAAVLFKALKDIKEETQFEEVVKTLEALTAVPAAAELFVEKGAGGESEPAVQESAVARIIKSNLNK